MTRLEQIRKRLAAATPGPWRYDGMHNEITTPMSNDAYWLIVSECRSAPDQTQRPTDEFGHCFDANFELIAHMREDMALLLAVVDVVRGTNAPKDMAAKWRRIANNTRPIDDKLAAQFDEQADAWEELT